MHKISKIHREPPRRALGPNPSRWEPKTNKADNIPFCPECRQCWARGQYWERGHGQPKTVAKWPMPPYGKPKKFCPECTAKLVAKVWDEAHKMNREIDRINRVEVA